MGLRLGVVLGALAGVFLLLAPGAQAARGCPGKLPAKVKLPSAEVHEFERTAYVRVRPRGSKPLRGVKVRVKFGKLTLARGAVEGKLKRSANVPLEFLEPLEARRDYDVIATGRLRGCGSRRERVSKPVTFSDAGGGGGDLPGPGANVQGLVVDWSGGDFSGGRDTASVNLPGIGRAEAVCNPNQTWLRVYPDDPGRSTAMLLWTYRDWVEGREGAVREAETTPFSGADFREGLNKFAPPERYSEGSFTGVISDRLAFGAPGGVGAPPTAVELSWKWDFSGGTESRCEVMANFTTEAPGSTPPLARSLAVNWSGDANAIANGAAATGVAGLGDARLDCQAGSGIRRFTLFPEAGVGPVNFTAYEGSDVTRSTQAQGPYRHELPNNGLVVADFGPGQGKLFLSSRWKTNDPDGSQNFCNLAGVLVAAA